MYVCMYVCMYVSIDDIVVQAILHMHLHALHHCRRRRSQERLFQNSFPAFLGKGVEEWLLASLKGVLVART